MDYFAAMRAFVRAVDLGSFSKAAAESGSKVSTISRHVAALEADLGAALLNRSTRRIALTEAGQAFYARAAGIIEEVDDARRATSALNSRPRGLLRVTVPGAFGRLHVMPAVPGFLTSHPDIQLEVEFCDSRVDLIETRTDLAIRIGTLANSGLKSRRLVPHYRVLCVGPGLGRSLQHVRQPEDLGAVECLTMAENECWHCRQSAPQAPDRDAHRSVAVTGRFRSTDLQAQRTAVLAELGVALLPAWLVREDIDSGRLSRLLTAWDFALTDDFDQAVWALYPPKRIVSPKVRAFIDYMQQRLTASLTLPGMHRPG